MNKDLLQKLAAAIFAALVGLVLMFISPATPQPAVWFGGGLFFVVLACVATLFTIAPIAPEPLKTWLYNPIVNLVLVAVVLAAMAFPVIMAFVSSVTSSR
jgi:hypothetical protein